jgi:DNA primase
MNCQQAKKIPITHYLHTKGIQPKTIKNGSAWYYSPFRNETTPSFKVDRQNNIWYDFGTGTGGNLLDLVMNIEKTGIAGALMILQRPELSNTRFSFSEQQ